MNEDDCEKLFNKIISTIKKEQELRRARRTTVGFALLLAVSVIAVPFSWSILAIQIESSGIYYFLSMAIDNLGIFLAAWKDFGLVILEVLPILGVAFFAASIGMALFTLRLFLSKKRLLINYLTNSYGY